MVIEQNEKTFGEEIRRLRTEKGMSLRELAKEADISNTYLSYIERGVHGPPSADKVKKLSFVLGANPDHLLKLAGHNDPEIAEWLRSKQEDLNPAIRKSQESGGIGLTGVIVASFILYALFKADREDTLLKNSEDGEDEFDFSQISPKELCDAFESQFKALDDTKKRDFAQLLKKTASLWLRNLNSPSQGESD